MNDDLRERIAAVRAARQQTVMEGRRKHQEQVKQAREEYAAANVDQPEPPAAPAPAALRRARQDSFLRALVQCFGNISAAARASDIPRENHVRWFRHSASYRERFQRAADEAKQLKCDAIEAEIHRRGVLGWEEVTTTETIDADGKKTIKTVRRNLKDTTALIFEAKAEMPDKYRERTETEHKVSGEIKQTHEHSGTLSVAAVRRELLNDPDYLAYLEHRALLADSDGHSANGNAGALRADDRPGALAAREAPSGT